MQPAVQIDVDETSGIWRTDGLPMVYVPRHFMVNMHNEIEQALGREAYAEVLDRSGAKSALHWCRRQAELRGDTPQEIVAFYLERLSQRGWGRFAIETLDTDKLTARVTLEESIYVHEVHCTATATTCYIFEGFLIGAMQFLCATKGIEPKSITCTEVACAALGAPLCRFELICERAA
ncbi:hypothetical protein FGG78_22275 [Thioclava sp. BHET1]|nr:hypothetical protein FGG78_22275 [Thioclava sp. BHET1]